MAPLKRLASLAWAPGLDRAGSLVRCSALIDWFHMAGDWKLGGAVSLAFFVVGAPAALLIGFLADRVDRYRVRPHCSTTNGGSLSIRHHSTVIIKHAMILDSVESVYFLAEPLLCPCGRGNFT